MPNFSRKRVILILVGLLFLVCMLLFLKLGLFLITPAEKEGKVQEVVIKEGLSLKEVSGELEKRKIIASKALFELWGKFVGASRKIKAGEYRLSPELAPIKILEILTQGNVITYPVTIPEGYTSEQISEILDRKNLVKKQQFLSLVNDPAVLEKYGVTGSSLEGYLYPDTYHLAKGIAASTAIDTMVNRFWDMVGPLKKRAEEMGMKMEDVIILASIVEKETGLAEERPTISSVFLNRLKRGMRLESDPTVIYGLKDFNGNLTREDLGNPTRYNTYIIRGLPPGPIANPGLESIKAVLFPAKTDYLYFVSKNDGSHHFSRTLSEHNKAVQIYQKHRRSK